MIISKQAFSGFSVDDQEKAVAFYRDVLELSVNTEQMGFTLQVGGGTGIFVYAKPGHQPASFTILNFPVDNIETTIDELVSKGIVFIQYDNPQIPQDSRGILRGKSVNMGPDIAWFTDPAGNILSIIED